MTDEKKQVFLTSNKTDIFTDGPITYQIGKNLIKVESKNRLPLENQNLL